jgi:hypothetical protein
MSEEQEKIKNDDNIENYTQGKPKAAPMLYSGRLAEILGFTGGDLTQNKFGRFSDFQLKAMTAYLKEERDAMWLILSILLGAGLLVAVILLPAGQYVPHIVFTLGTIVLSAYFYSQARQGKMQNDISTNRVLSTRGVPELLMPGWWRRSTSSNPYLMKIGDKELNLTAKQFFTLYGYELPFMTVYYAGNSMKVIAGQIYDEDDESSLLEDEKVKNDSLRIEDPEDNEIQSTERK